MMRIFTLWLLLFVLPLLVSSSGPSTPPVTVDPSHIPPLELSIKEKQSNLIKKFKGYTHLHLSIKNGNITSNFDSSRKIRYVNPYTAKAQAFDQLSATIEFLEERWMIKHVSNQRSKTNPQTLRMMLSLLSNELVDPRNKLFTSTESNQLYNGFTNSSAILQIDRFPHRKSHEAFISPMIYPECKNESRCDVYFKMVGHAIAVAVLNKQFMDITFTSSFYKFILGHEIGLNDIQEMNPSLFNKLNVLLKSDDLANITMTYEHFDGNKTEARDLVPYGSSILVTEENKHTYVHMTAQAHFNNHVGPAMTSLCAGLFEIIPKNEIQVFTEGELRLLISGNVHIDVNEWKEYTTTNAILHVFNARSNKWFWQIVEKWSMDMKSRLLMYVTGSSRLPLDGFKAKRSTLPILEWFSLPVDGYNMHWSPLPYYTWFTLVFHPHTNTVQASTIDGWMWLPRFRSLEEMQEALENMLLLRGGVSAWYYYNADYREFSGIGHQLAYRH